MKDRTQGRTNLEGDSLLKARVLTKVWFNLLDSREIQFFSDQSWSEVARQAGNSAPEYIQGIQEIGSCWCGCADKVGLWDADEYILMYREKGSGYK